MLEIPANASAQRRAVDEIKFAENKIVEFQQIYNITIDSQIQHGMATKIYELHDEISSNKNKIIKLKRNVKYVQNCRDKKLKMLTENQEVVRYDRPGQPHFSLNIQIYMIKFMIQLNLDQLMQNEKRSTS